MRSFAGERPPPPIASPPSSSDRRLKGHRDLREGASPQRIRLAARWESYNRTATGFAPLTRMRAKLLAIKIELRRTMHDPIAKTGAWVKRMLQGHLNYFAVSGNHPSLWWFLNKVKRLWLTSLKRRSQTARLSWESSSGSSPASFRRSGRYTHCHLPPSTPN